MAYLIEVPVEGGGRLLVAAQVDDLPGDLELAALRPGEIAARAGKSLEQALDQVKPAVHAVVAWLTAMCPDEAAVEFGITLGAETGVVVAKGSGEVHFNVTLTWNHTDTATSTSGSRLNQAGPEVATDV